MSPKLVTLLKFSAAVSSGVLMALGFPPFDVPGAVWIGLAPLVMAIVLSDPRKGFQLGLLSGAVCWLMSMLWMLKLFDTSPAPAAIILLGWLLLCGYCALFTGAFGMSLAWLASRVGIERIPGKLALVFSTPLLWTGFEYVRSVLLGGFPWNLIGVTQYSNLSLIQMAEWTGVYGVSALIVLFNASVALTAIRYRSGRAAGGYQPHVELFVGVIAVALAFRGGMIVAAEWRPTVGSFTVAAVQPNIPQVKKWEEGMEDQILSTLRGLTTVAASAEKPPALIVWPETSVPGLVTAEGACRDLVADMCRLGAPLLVGAMDIIESGANNTCYNSSFLFDAEGRIAKRYDKQHLVPFGEYIPLSGLIPVLGRLAPMGWNCTAGRESTIFACGTPAVAFSTLICFEDVMPWLSRRAVQRGARFLINQTNDAWFDRTGGPAQHMAQCVFRAVENRVPVLRVANSGITCLIHPSGLVDDRTQNSRDEAPESLVRTWAVSVDNKGRSLTFYARHGDMFFAVPCAVFAIVCLVLAVVAWRRNEPAPAAAPEKAGEENL